MSEISLHIYKKGLGSSFDACVGEGVSAVETTAPSIYVCLLHVRKRALWRDVAKKTISEDHILARRGSRLANQEMFFRMMWLLIV